MDQILEQLLGYVRGVWRRRWYIVAVAWIVAIGGWAWVYSLPDQYRATARVYVDTQSLLAPLLGNMTIRPRVEQRLNIMTRTLLSRPNLEEVARRADLDVRAETPQQMESIINGLDKNLKLNGSNRENLYQISYVNQDPQLARKVVQSLLNIFVENGLGNTRQDLNTSQKFIGKQVDAYKEHLSKLEDKIKAFKQKNGQLLSDQGGDYYSQLDQARNRYQQAKLQLQEAVSRRDSYKARLSGKQPTLLEPSPKGQGVAELDSRINDLERKLDQLRLKYTEQYPDVQATKRVIANLKEQRKQLVQRQRNAPEDFSGDNQVSSYLQQLQFALAQAESDVASLQSRVKEYKDRLDTMRAQVDRIPEVQAQYKNLMDEYHRVKNNYDKLVSTRDKAEMSQKVENDTQSVDFRVVDPPFVPSKPVGPKRVVLASGVLLFALAAGTGIAFLLSQLRRTVDTRRTLNQLSGRPFLGSVSMTEGPQRARRRRLGYLAYACSALVLLGAYGSLVAFFMAG